MRRTMKVDRREFLKKAGSRSIAVMSLTILTDALAIPALADDQMSFIFEVNSAAGRPGTPTSPQHRIAIGGCGTFSPGRVGSSVVGGGTYTRFLFPGANPPMGGGTSLPLVGSGTWRARQLVSWKTPGTYGVYAAGILEIVADMFQEVPSKAVTRGARFKVVCNLGFAAIGTPGEDEGVTVSIPGTDFFTGATPGPFLPIPVPGTPGLGLTVFNTVAMP